MATTTTLSYSHTIEARTARDSTEVNENYASILSLFNSVGIGTNNIKDASISTAKFEDLGVGTGDFAAGAATSPKLAAVSRSFTADSDNIGVTIEVTFATGVVTTARASQPVYLSLLYKDDSADNAGANMSNSTATTLLIRIYQDGNLVAYHGIEGTSNRTSHRVWHVSQPTTAATHTFAVTAVGIGGTGSIQFVKGAVLALF